MCIRDSNKVVYHYLHDSPSRRFATGASAQGLSSRHIEQLVDSAIEIDIHNCMFTIVTQLLDMRELYETGDAAMDKHFRFPSFRACAASREAALGSIASQIGMDAAKQLNLEVAGGAAIPDQFQGNEYLQSLQAEAKLLRWLAISLLPSGLYDAVSANPKHRWPEATMVYLMWSGFEDAVLAAMAETIQSLAPPHMSLHFDGVRVSRQVLVSDPELLQHCEENIAAKTGFAVKLVSKVQHYFFHELSLHETVPNCNEGFNQRQSSTPCARRHDRPRFYAPP